MSTRPYTFPVVIWPLQGGQLLGAVVDTDHVLIEQNMKDLLALVSDEIRKQQKREGFIYPPELEKIKMKNLKVSIRPAYYEEKIYPADKNVEIPVTAVYGEGEGYNICFLPLLDRSFYYYESQEVNTFIEQYAREYFEGMTPEVLYRYLLMGKPQLEKIEVKLDLNSEIQPKLLQNRQRFRVLQAMAERLPVKQKKQNRLVPDVAWERNEDVRRLVDKLLSERVSVILLGEAGSGKSAVLNDALRKIYNQSKQKNAEIKTLWRTTAQRIVADAKYLGEWQEQCEDLIEDLRRAKGLLWLEDLVQLLNTGGSSVEDSVAAFFFPYLKSGEIQLVSELSQSELDALRRLYPEFVELFQILPLAELDEAAVFRIMHQFAEHVSRSISITLTDSAMEMAYRLYKRYVRYEHVPGSILRFLKRLVAYYHLEDKSHIRPAEVIKDFTQKTGLPELLLVDDQLLHQETLQGFFSQRVIGQDAGVDALVNVINIFKAGLNDPNKPIASLFFAGPTGVGKTASAKALADYFFGQGQSKHPLIRIDMSEYQHPGQIYRLIGGGKEVGELVRQVREHPFSVVLLDEIEKAHPAIYDVLMTVLDEGLLVDAFGRQTHFHNCIIIMTSNLGAQQGNSIGFHQQDKGNYANAVQKHFRPEFYNRIDHLVVFQSLQQQHIEAIAVKELNEIKERDGIKNKGIKLRFTQSLIHLIVQHGFDPKYGARPLQRAIERYVVGSLARYLLENPKLKDKQLTVDWAEDEVVFH